MWSESWKIGYVLDRFPTLSETFILNEVLELERVGVRLEVVSLRRPVEEPRHGLLKEVRSPVTYLPENGLPEWRIGEGPFGDGTIDQRPPEQVFQQGRTSTTFALPNVLIRLARQVRTIEELPILVAQMKAIPQAVTLSALVKAKGVRHLHAHFGQEATTVAMLASRLTGLTYSFTTHAYDIYNDQQVDRALLKEKVRRARFVITVSEYNRRVLATIGGPEAAGKIVRVYNGLDLTRFQPDPSIRRGQDLILAVGRLVQKKGFRDLIRALRFLEDRGRTFRCLIVGAGEERDLLAQQIISCGLQDRVTLTGQRPQEQVVQLMKEATALVLPCVVSASGDRDGLPSVLIEALAVGLPAISTTVSGVPELIVHGKTGLLVTPGDSMALAAAIEQVLVSPELRERLARAGLRKVRDEFDIRKNIAALRRQFASSVPLAPRSRA